MHCMLQAKIWYCRIMCPLFRGPAAHPPRLWNNRGVRGTLKAKRSDAEVIGVHVAQRWLDCHLTKLVAYLAEHRRLTVSTETARQGATNVKLRAIGS